jgi:hypothetical protein
MCRDDEALRDLVACWHHLTSDVRVRIRETARASRKKPGASPSWVGNFLRALLDAVEPSRAAPDRPIRFRVMAKVCMPAPTA